MLETYSVRYMRLTDIPQVAWIDQQSFSTPWSAGSYVREVVESSYSHMLVVERLTRTPPDNRIHAMWNWMRGQTQVEQTTMAYGGLWLFDQESHISTIASHPHHRRQGWGELALVAMLRRSVMLKAGYALLEVRVSNTSAQRLYDKYGFEKKGRKKGYYYDNNEDAYIMVLNLGPSRVRRFIETRYQAYRNEYRFKDTYTNHKRPDVAIT